MRLLRNRPWRFRRVAWLLLPLALMAGCNDTQKESVRPEPKGVSTGNLPKLGDYLPPLDQSRVEIAPPAEWHIPPRSSKWIARFQQSDESQYPSIIITAEDCQSIFTVSESNLSEFADQIAAEQSVAEVKPVTIGRFAGVAYQKRGKEKQSIDRILERLFLETVVAGRKYCIELRTREGSLAEGQPYLFAVANGIRFLGAQPAEGKLQKEPAGELEAEAAEKPEKEEIDQLLQGLEDLFKQQPHASGNDAF